MWYLRCLPLSHISCLTISVFLPCALNSVPITNLRASELPRRMHPPHHPIGNITCITRRATRLTQIRRHISPSIIDPRRPPIRLTRRTGIPTCNRIILPQPRAPDSAIRAVENHLVDHTLRTRIQDLALGHDAGDSQGSGIGVAGSGAVEGLH
jgi:hypothetical protein